MNMHIKNNITETATNLWNFVNDFEVGNLADTELDMPECNAIHNIIKACESIVETKLDLYKLLNNTLE